MSRLLLYMIAHPSIRVLLTHLRPPVGASPRPVDELPKYPQTFRCHGGADSPPFSLEGVLKSVEHLGYREEAQPVGLALSLKRYQQQALGWMIDMERLPRGINGLFWEERPFADGGAPFHYSPQLGEMRLAAPPVMHGGLLCDEMGLGKTLAVVALVLTTPHQPMEPAPDGLIPSRATLIVVPPTLVSQWLAEVDKSVGVAAALVVAAAPAAAASSNGRGGGGGSGAAGAVEAVARRSGGQVHAGRPHPQGRQWAVEEAAALAAHDIVIATYGALDRCVTALGAISWRRVVLDEMQEVRSSTTELAKKCERLHGPRRWMVSGTPLYDKISDLQGELYFLRVSPFGAGHEDGFWRHVIGAPWQASDDSALDALQVLLTGDKTQTDGTHPRAASQDDHVCAVELRGLNSPRTPTSSS